MGASRPAVGDPAPVGEPGPGGDPGAGPAPLQRSGGLPLWRQIYADLRRRLEDGEFPGTFPGELSLAAEYEVSRHTVREALRHLRSEGAVIGERGRPSRLAPPAIAQPLGVLYSLFASAETLGLDQRSVVRMLDVRADGVVATRLGLEESTPLIYLERLRLVAEIPLAVDRVWLPAAIAAPLLAADFSHTALYDELAARTGLRPDGGCEQMHAAVATAAERRLLEIPAGVAVFRIDRLSRCGTEPLEWRCTLVRGDRFSVTAEFAAGAVTPGLRALPPRPGYPPPPTVSLVASR